MLSIDINSAHAQQIFCYTFLKNSYILENLFETGKCQIYYFKYVIINLKHNNHMKNLVIIIKQILNAFVSFLTMLFIITCTNAPENPNVYRVKW